GSMTWRPQARASPRSHRTFAFSSGAPRLISTVGISLCSRALMHNSAVSRVICSRRSGPASTWQCRQVWLHSFPTLSCRTVMPVACSGDRPAWAMVVANGGQAVVIARRCSCSRLEARGLLRETNVRPMSSSFLPQAMSHRQFFDYIAHLDAVDQRCPPTNSARHVHRLGHFLRIGALFEAGLAVGVNAIWALYRMADPQGDEGFLALG